MMDISKAFSYVMEDANWVIKVVIYAVLSFFALFLLPIPLILGYNVAITRNVKNGLENPLPEWDDFGKLFMDGLYIFIAQMVYTLPFWLISCIAVVATVGLGGLGGAVGSDSAAAASAMGIWGIWMVVGCLMLLLVVVAIFIMPALIIQYVYHDNLAACFRFGEVFAIARDNIGDILITLVAAIGAGFVLFMIIGVLSFIPCLGSIIGWLLSMVITPYLNMALSHMYGQIAAKNKKLAGFA
ncbi:MAG: DUF4013 domain-containing protein [Anaerolineae bacterium]|nr:DUF4013 domain-containing protein [Anaerolineae bacterium]